MKRDKIKAVLFSLAACVALLVPTTSASAAVTLTNNATGNENGYDYELWKDYGNTSMTLNGNGNFSCQWSNIGNALFRKGVKFDSTKTYQQIGNITFDYGCEYYPNGNSYLCVYGWTKDPLIEYYIVDSWGSWRPPGGSPKGQINVDGGTYDVYETTRVNQPSIIGDTTFKQYFSVRTSKRTSGTISVSEHFKAWERMGMKCGKLYEAALNVEGYQSSGSANVYKNIITVGGSSSSNQGGNSGNNNSGNSGSSNAGNNLVTVADADKIQCENMTKGGQYTGNHSSKFNGVALYGNDDCVKFTQDFKQGTHDFTLRGCSNNDNMARVDLVIGGENKGTFYFGDANPAEYTIKNVSHKTGKQEVKLVVTADDGNWDAYVDWLGIGGISKETSSSNQGSNNQGSSNQNQNQNQNQGNTSNNNTNQNTGNTTTTSNNSVQCENMTKSGQYTGNVSNPFNGVALYANNDAVSFNQYFAYDTHDFTLRGCSNNNNMARVDLKIGGENKGTFYFGDNYPAEYKIENVRHKTGDQKVELIVTADDGNWDAYVDWLKWDTPGTTSSSPSGSNNNTNNNTNTGTTINKNAKLVALTFDDGPSTTTPYVLDVLERYGVPATFFLIGQQVNGDTRAIMERQLRDGCELACHSYTHSDMSNMSASQIRNEIEWCSSAIKNTVGYDVKYFRPPYLATSNRMYENIDLTFIQGITCDDWDSSTNASYRANAVLNNVSDGTIVLLHDFQGNNATVEALPRIIEELKKQGYTFVTLTQLFDTKGVYSNVEYKIWSQVK